MLGTELTWLSFRSKTRLARLRVIDVSAHVHSTTDSWNLTHLMHSKPVHKKTLVFVLVQPMKGKLGRGLTLVFPLFHIVERYVESVLFRIGSLFYDI